MEIAITFYGSRGTLKGGGSQFPKNVIFAGKGVSMFGKLLEVLFSSRSFKRENFAFL